jgi:hypothetical protein
MEFKSSSSNIKKVSRRTSKSIFMDLADEYQKVAQQTQVDPNQLSVGDTIYDADGTEFQVIADPDNTTNKILMPTQEEGMTTPATEAVEDVELGMYTQEEEEGGVQYAEVAETATSVSAKKAQEDIDWPEIQSMALDLNALARQENMQGVIASLEELTNYVLGYIDFPADMPMSMGSLDNILPEFRTAAKKTLLSAVKLKENSGKLKVFKDVAALVSTTETVDINRKKAFHEPVGSPTELNGEVKNMEDSMLEDYTPGDEPGFVDVMNCIKDMVDQNYDVIDLMLNVGERFPRDLGTAALHEARAQGIL